MIHLTAKCHINPANREKFIELAQPLITASRQETGCHAYALYGEINDPSILTFIEQWENQAILDAHTQTPHFLEIFPKLVELQTQDPEVNLYEKF